MDDPIKIQLDNINKRIDQVAVSSEASSRISGDQAVQANVDAEVAARIAAVSAEADARIAGDAAQGTALATEIAITTGNSYDLSIYSPVG